MGSQGSRQRLADNDRKSILASSLLEQKELLKDLDYYANALVEIPSNDREFIQGLRQAAECEGCSASFVSPAPARKFVSPACLSEIAANLSPLLVARKRLQDQMKAYQDGTVTASDKRTSWERCPWKRSAAADAGETHRFHLLAQGTDVADLAIDRFPGNKGADHRIKRLTKPPVKDAVFVNGT